MISVFLIWKLNYYWGNKWARSGQRRMKNLTKAKRKEEVLMTLSMISIFAVLLLLLPITATIATIHVKATDCLDRDLSILKTPPAILWHTGWRWNFISSTRLRSTETRALQWKHGSAQHSRVICHNIWTVTNSRYKVVMFSTAIEQTACNIPRADSIITRRFDSTCSWMTMTE